MTSNSRLQTNVLAKFIDIKCIIFYIHNFQPFLVHETSFQKNTPWTASLCWHVMDNEPKLCCSRWTYVLYCIAKVLNFQENCIKDLWKSPWTTKNSRGTTGVPSGKTKKMWKVASTSSCGQWRPHPIVDSGVHRSGSLMLDDIMTCTYAQMKRKAEDREEWRRDVMRDLW